jgi:hypothetical protein
LHEESRVAICGTEEFAELVYLGLKKYGIGKIDVFGATKNDDRKFLGIAVRDIATLEPEQYDRIVIAFPGRAPEAYGELLQREAAEDRLVVFFADDKSREGK